MPQQNTNYEILEANKKAALNFADNIKTKPILGQNAIKAKQTEAKALLLSGDFSAAIEKLNEIKDNKLGIVWHKSEDLGNGTKALLRDARAVNTNLDDLRIEAGEKYGMQILNEVRAGINLINKAELPEAEKTLARKKLFSIATDALDNLDKLGNKNIKIYNTQIISVLDDANIPYTQEVNGKKRVISSEVQLNFAKELTHLGDDHRHIVTLTSVKDATGKQHTVTEADIMLNGLTDKLKRQYENIANSEEGKSTGIVWFDNMSPHKKKLLRDVAPEIASGKKIIPTQLLSDVAGLKNAYQKVTAIKERDQKDSKIILESLHCGTPATKIKVINEEQKQEIADENIKQLQTFVKPGEKINLNILNSKFAYADKIKSPIRGQLENFIFDQVHQGVKNNNIDEKKIFSSTASPINGYRKIGAGKDTEQFKDNLKLIGSAINSNSYIKNELSAMPNTSKYLENGSSIFDKMADAIPVKFIKSTKTKALEEIAKREKSNILNNSDEKKFTSDLKTAIEARSLADRPILLADSENANAELTAKMSTLQESVKNGSIRKTLGIIGGYPINVNFCKSGKDRTGYVEMKQSRVAILNHLGISENTKEAQEVFIQQMAGGHTQEMAGIQGGTIGCHSIKANFEFKENKEYQMAKDIVNQKTASFNSSIKTVKDKKKDVIVADFNDKFEKQNSSLNKEAATNKKLSVSENLSTKETKENIQILVDKVDADYEKYKVNTNPSRSANSTISSHRRNKSNQLGK